MLLCHIHPQIMGLVEMVLFLFMSQSKVQHEEAQFLHDKLVSCICQWFHCQKCATWHKL